MLIELLGPAFAWEVTGADWTWQSPATDHDWQVEDEAVSSALADAQRLWNAVEPEVFQWPLGSDPSASGRIQVLPATVGTSVAVAETWSVGDRLVDCSITLYEANGLGSTDLTTTLPTPSGHTQLRYVLAHELGHCLGLDHSAADALMRARVTPTRSRDWSLRPDDVNGFAAIYAAGPADLSKVGWTVEDRGDGDGLFEPGESLLLTLTFEGTAVGARLDVGPVEDLDVVRLPLSPTAVELRVPAPCSSGTLDLPWMLTAANADPLEGRLPLTLTCPPASDTGSPEGEVPKGCSTAPVGWSWPFRRR